jgi:hypothetical protein
MVLTMMAVLALLACGEDVTGPPPPTVVSVVVTPSSAMLGSLGETVQFTAAARDASGNAIAGKTFTWSSGDTQVATVDATVGLVTAVAKGTTLIVATTDGVEGSASVTVAIPGPTILTLLTGLEYPKGIWLKDGSVYITETAGRNTSFGGNVSLLRYDVGTGQLTPLVDNPVNSDAVAVAGDGKIYLASYHPCTPGESGRVSVVDPITLVESHLVDLAVAANDIFLDSNEDMYISGSSDLATGASLNLLPAGNYTSVTVLEEGLGRIGAMTKVGADIYFSNIIDDRILRRDGSGNITTIIRGVNAVSSLTSAGSHLYYSDFSAGVIGRFDLQSSSPVVEIIAAELAHPLAVRYDAQTESLYFLDSGTSAGQYKDGTLGVITGLP